MDRVEYLARQQQYKIETIFDSELKRYRIANGLSQNELAEITGASVQSISQTEIGMLSPRLNGEWKLWVVKASSALGASPEELFPRESCEISFYPKDECSLEMCAILGVHLIMNTDWI